MPLTVLGITNHKDAGAALVVDGGIAAAANEERFSRTKLHLGFPYLSAKWVLDRAGLTEFDVDIVAYGWSRGIEIGALQAINERYERETRAGNLNIIAKLNERVASEIQNQETHRAEFFEGLKKAGLDHCRVELIDHHKAHAHGAFLTSPFDEALVVTMDGKGDFKCASVGIGKGNEYNETECVPTFDSPGYFYGIITKLLGFKTERHEGKITGLAARGAPDTFLPVMEKMLAYEDGRITGRIGDYFLPWFTTDLPGLKELDGASRDDVAAACQKQLEIVVTAFIRDRLEKHGQAKICLSGGVFANVKLNQRINELPGVEAIYVHPNMGDGGLGLGAALAVSSQMGVKAHPPLENVYLGSQSDDAEIEAVLSDSGLEWRRLEPGEKIDLTLDLIEKDRIIGWFQGRMEYGPRALGARSIIYHPKDASVNDWLNHRLHRSEFMPFAPVTTVELAGKCFVGWKPEDIASRFMTVCYDCTETFARLCPAVVHVDNTARPQVVRREDMPDYYDLIMGYYQRTGIPCLINTSFNDHEQPIVRTPKDAVESMKLGNVDDLIIGEYRVWQRRV